MYLPTTTIRLGSLGTCTFYHYQCIILVSTFLVALDCALHEANNSTANNTMTLYFLITTLPLLKTIIIINFMGFTINNQ